METGTATQTLSSTFFQIENWGLINYVDAYKRQQATVQEVIKGAKPRLIFCEHPAVITLGRMSHSEHLLLTESEFNKKGIEVKEIDRGGDVTLHAPGQLIIYPIMSLEPNAKDLHKYLYNLEQVMIDLLNDFDIVANRFQGNTGVWVDGRKLVSMGIGVRKWVTYHGIGLNCNTDLDLFKYIVPCGLNVKMTSMQNLLGKNICLNNVVEHSIKHFDCYFGETSHV